MTRPSTSPADVIAFIRSAAHLPADADPAASLSAVGIDSLDFIDLMLSIETHYDVRLPIEEMDDQLTLGAFAQWVSDQLV